MPAALVTGGAVRLGRAMALHLAKQGFDIALHYGASRTAAEQTLSEICDLGVRAEGYSTNLTDLNTSESLVEKVIKDFPDLELLVNSAANFIQENVEQTRTETLRDTFHINLMSPFLLMREYKRRVNRGMIVNILDERIERNDPVFAAYSVSKAGLSHLTGLAAIEWGRTVRVNGIAPGLILPPAGQSDDYLIKGAKRVPTGTHGTEDDITRALQYLLDSPFVNGEILFVDGGESKNDRRQG